MCIYIENGLFSQFFETYCITVFTVVEKVCDIKYCVGYCGIVTMTITVRQI